MGSWRKELLRPLLCILSNTCWNGGVHPSLRCSSKSPFAYTVTHLSRDPTLSDGETSSGSICEFWLSLCVGLGSTCIYLCVRICVSAVSCSFGRSYRTGHRRTCRCPSSSFSSSEGQSRSRSAPPQWTRLLSPASPPGEHKKSQM